MKCFRNLDIFSYKAHFTFNDNGDTGYKTFIGGLLSFISIFISIIFSLFFIYRFFKKEDFTILYSSQIDNLINMTNSNTFPFLFRLSDNYSNPLEQNGLYEFTFKIWYKNTSTLNYDYDIISIEKCNINKHFGNYISIFKEMNDINSFFCPSIRLNNQSLYGIYGSHQFIYYNVDISKCNNETNNNTCLSEIEINNTLKNVYFDLRFIDYSIDNFNKKNPEILYIRNERILTSIKIFQKVYLLFKKIIYYIDIGYFQQYYSKKNFHQYDNLKINSVLIENDDTFFSLSISNSGKVINYKKNYLKFQHYVSYIGGFYKSISFIFYLLNYFNSKNSYYKKLIKDFIIENQIKKKDKNLTYLDRNILNSTNNKLLNSKNNHLFSVNRGSNQNSKIENVKSLNDKRNSLNIINRFKDKDEIEKKFSLTIFPLNISSYKKDLVWYIKIINKRMNIIYILNILEQIENQLIKKKVNTLLIKSSASDVNNQINAQKKINNYYGYSNIYKKNDIIKELDFK